MRLAGTHADIYYAAKALTQQISNGQGYESLKSVICIHFLDFDLFTQASQQEQSHWCFEMRDRWTPQTRLGDELELNIIELRKADQLMGSNIGSELKEWIIFFQHWNEEAAMANVTSPSVRQAFNQLQALSADPETQRLAAVRERALRDEIALLNDAQQRGIEIGQRRGIEIGQQRGIEIGQQRGIEIGQQEGRREAMEETLRRLIDSGMPESQARSILGM